MFEANNGSVLVPDLTSAINIIEEKERKIASLEAFIKTQADEVTNLQTRLTRADDYAGVQRGIIKMHVETIEKAGDLIKPLLEDETIEPTSQLGEDLMTLLNIDLTKEVVIHVSMRWTVTATIPSHYDAQEWVNEQSWTAELETSAELDDRFNDPDVIAEAF